MEDDLQSAGLSRERVALFVGPRCLLRPDPPPLFRVTNTPPLKLNRFWAQRSMRQVGTMTNLTKTCRKARNDNDKSDQGVPKGIQ